MILPKREDGFFPEMEDLPLLEVTAETGLWYLRTEEIILAKYHIFSLIPIELTGHYMHNIKSH